MPQKIASSNTVIDGLLKLTFHKYRDHRGFFYESYTKKDYTDLGINDVFIQDNISYSKKDTLRGLHYQLNQGQSKILNVIQGEIFDVIVDIRINSPTFMNVFSAELNQDSNVFLYIPPGLAHGFYVKSDETLISYKCSNYYDPDDEYGLHWKDQDLNIPWPFEVNKTDLLISSKDKNFSRLKNINSDYLPVYAKK